MRTLILLAVVGLQGCYAAEGWTQDVKVGVLITAILFTLWAFVERDSRRWWAPWGIGLIVFVVALAACSAQAAEIDMPLLRDTICERESRHLNYPAFAVGDGGSSRGECQMSVDTAIWIIPYAVKRGYVPAYMLAMLTDRQALTYFLHYRPVNFALSEAYLMRIAKKRKARTVRELAYFWNAGHNSERFGAKPDSVAFANEVWIMYKGAPLASPKIVQVAQQRTFARD
jgi:hypothetical protein